MTERKDEGVTINVTSHNQSGGITAHTVNIGRQRFEMTENVMERIASLLDPKREVTVWAEPSSRTPRLAKDLFDYLNRRGFFMNGFIEGKINPSPPWNEPITIFPYGWSGEGVHVARDGRQLIFVDSLL